MWVVQEVLLSQQHPIIIHGDCHYTWKPLGWAVGWLRRSGYLRLPQVSEQLRNIDTISNLRRARTRWPLDALMSVCQVNFHASDQRHKVYGLLGLALECEDSSALPEELKPDYTIDAATVYQRVARYLLKRNRSLAIVNRANCIDRTETRKQRTYDLDLPSWCPDWSDFETYNESISTSFSWIEYSNIFEPANFGFPNCYRASGGLEAKLHGTESAGGGSSVLQLGGFIVNQVAHVLRFNIKPCSHKLTSDELDYMMAPILELVLSDGASWLHGFFERRKDLASLYRKHRDEIKLDFQLQEASRNGVEEDYIALVRNFCFGRSFFITMGGLLRIGPSNTLQGDTISVILGGGVPYIIRVSGDYWTLVGESYINGLMDGETIERYTMGVIQEKFLSFK